jgi:hypothetical protein
VNAILVRCRQFAEISVQRSINGTAAKGPCLASLCNGKARNLSPRPIRRRLIKGRRQWRIGSGHHRALGRPNGTATGTGQTGHPIGWCPVRPAPGQWLGHVRDSVRRVVRTGVRECIGRDVETDGLADCGEHARLRSPAAFNPGGAQNFVHAVAIQLQTGL